MTGAGQELRFAGYAALFDRRDAGGDVIRKGAFARTLAESATPIPLFWQHRPEQRIGWVETIAEDSKGLRVVASIDKSDGGAAASLRQGKATGLSFGYRARGYSRDEAGRVLTDIQLLEVSLVTHPMQHRARVHMVQPTVEQKFNQRHYRENGQFARAGEGVLYGAGSQPNRGFRNGDGAVGRTRRNPANASTDSKPKSSPTPDRGEVDAVAKRQRSIGALAAKYESRRLEGPGTISSGGGDPGGVSYGTFQLSSTRRRVHEFVASVEARPWSEQLRGKQPATREFDAQWRAIAAADPVNFEAAQRAFIVRTNYSDGARMVRQAAGFELENANPAVRQAFFATAVQHGATGGGGLFADAVRQVDQRLKRNDDRYESALINALYNQRTRQRSMFIANTTAKARELEKAGRGKEASAMRGRARLAENDVRLRYPRERYDALLLLSGQPMSSF